MLARGLALTFLGWVLGFLWFAVALPQPAGPGQADAVVVLTVDPEELVQRLLQRAQTDGRADDTEEVVRRRQEVYTEQTAPLIEVYRDRGILVEVDGMGEVDDVTRRIFDALDVVPQS